MLFKFALFSIVSIALSSCHPSDNGTTSTPLTVEQKSVEIKGLLVDGYISGAEVCLFEGNREINCTTSDANGSYSFPLTSFASNSMLIVRARGGVDTASQTPYSGTLSQLIDLSQESDTTLIERNITPLSDLKTLVSLDNNLSLAETEALFAQVYEIAQELVDGDPMQDNTLFVASQDIEQSKALLGVMASKLYTDSLEATEIETLRYDIRKALAKIINDTQELSIDKTINLLEENWQKDVPFEHQFYVIGQREVIRQALEDFTQNSDLNAQNRADFQKALVEKTSESLQSFELLEDDQYLIPQEINIDIFAPDDTNSSSDTNDTNETTTDPETLFTITGSMIDGYIESATICIDTNNDSVCQTTEPRTTTAQDGNFSFSLSELEPNRYYRVIGLGGRDTATQKAFDGEYFGVLDTSTIDAHLFLTPLSDLVTRMFFRSALLDASTLDSVQNTLTQKLGISLSDLDRDPLSVKNLMFTSMGVESIYAVLASILKEELGASSLTTVHKDIIRDAILEEILDSGFKGFVGSRAIIRMELKLGIIFSEALRDFAAAQIAENLLRIANLNILNTVENNAFENVQKVFDEGLSAALATNTFQEININVEVVTYSKFDKTAALYDKEACLQNEHYVNSHTQLSNAERYQDVSNGIFMGFDTVEDNATLQSFTLFYPNLDDVIKTNRLVRFENDYFFAYDSAWVETGKTIYLEAPTTGVLSKCYRIELDALYGSDLDLIPVFRYTDYP